MRRRWVYIDGEALEVSEDYVTPARVTHTDSVLWNDRLYQDDNDKRYSSRKSHREYMRRNGLTTVDDFKEEWRMAAIERDARLRGVDPNRKHDIADAIRKIEAGYKPRVAREEDW